MPSTATCFRGGLQQSNAAGDWPGESPALLPYQQPLTDGWRCTSLPPAPSLRAKAELGIGWDQMRAGAVPRRAFTRGLVLVSGTCPGCGKGLLSLIPLPAGTRGSSWGPLLHQQLWISLSCPSAWLQSPSCDAESCDAESYDAES